MSESELQFLLALHKQIGSRICEHMGHDYEEIQIDQSQPVNVSRVERCNRCGADRLRKREMRVRNPQRPL